MPARKLNILLSGMIAADPYQGGAAWAVLQYVLGFTRLGHHVTLIEPIKSASLQPVGATLESSVNAAYFQDVVTAFGLEGSAALLHASTQNTHGVPYARLCELAREADLLINISGMLQDENLFAPAAIRVYLDLDPAFNQLWHAQGIDMRFAGHTHFVTVGQAIGEPGCSVPTCGHDWLKTFPPVVLEHWPVATTVELPAFTTVGNWRAYGSIEYEGIFYGQKAHSLRQFITLPEESSAELLLAMAIHADEKRDLAALTQHGWKLIEPSAIASTPAAYRRFVQGSLGELGIAKGGYVTSRCGWFSDRSAAYLASGRPVIAQDTAFAQFLPTSEGLFSFATIDQLLTALDRVQEDYNKHARGARDLAVEFFDSDKVLRGLLQRVNAT